MACPRCGTHNRAGVAFCQNCGANLRGTAPGYVPPAVAGAAAAETAAVERRGAVLGPVVLLIGLVGLVTGYLLPFAYGDDSLYDRAFGPGGYGIAFWNAYPSDSSLADTIYFGLAAPVPILAVLLAILAVAGFMRARPGTLQVPGLVIALAWSVGLIVMFLIVEVIGGWSGGLVDVLRQLTPGGIILFLASLIVMIGTLTPLRTELTRALLPELRNRSRRHRGLLPDLRPGDRPGRRDGDAGGSSLAGAGRPASPPRAGRGARPVVGRRPRRPCPHRGSATGTSTGDPAAAGPGRHGRAIGQRAAGDAGDPLRLADRGRRRDRRARHRRRSLRRRPQSDRAAPAARADRHRDRVFFPSVLASFPNLRLATLVVTLVGFGLSLDRLGFGGAGAGELLLFLGTAAAAMGAIILELGRDQPLGPVR